MTRHSARFSPPIFFYHLLSFFFLSFPFAPRPIPPLVKLLAPLRSWFLHPFLALADDITVHLHPIFPSLFSPSLFFLFCLSCLVTELPPLWTFRRGLPFRVSLSIPPFLFPLLFLFFFKARSFNATPFQPDAYRFRFNLHLRRERDATDGEKGGEGKLEARSDADTTR